MENDILNSFEESVKKVLNEGTIEGGYFYWYDQKYRLEYSDGSYERSPQLLIHHILFYEGFYQQFCSEYELAEIEETTDEPIIFRSDDYMDLLDDLHALGKKVIENYLA